MESHRDLIAWQKAMNLIVACYDVAQAFPGTEQFGLTSQLRRAAVSIAANIAEGHGRGATNAYLNHLSIANGSLQEVETHLLIAARLRFVSAEQIRPALALYNEVGRLVSGLRRSLRQQDSATRS